MDMGGRDARQGGRASRGAYPYPFHAGSRPRAGNPGSLACFTWNPRCQKRQKPRHPQEGAAGPYQAFLFSLRICAILQIMRTTPCRWSGFLTH